jgi:hypothetical protein
MQRPHARFGLFGHGLFWLSFLGGLLFCHFDLSVPEFYTISLPPPTLDLSLEVDSFC